MHNWRRIVYTYILNNSIIPTNKTESLFNEINYLFLSQIIWLPFEQETQVFQKTYKISQKLW